MQFAVDPQVLGKLPGLQIGVISCRGLTNGASPPEITVMLRDAERLVRERFVDAEALKTHPAIAAWQDAHRVFGSNPNKYPPSIFALCKRVVKGGELPSINALVDLYNAVSLRHLLPAGGEDVDRTTGDIRLTVAEGGESFVGLGATEPEPAEAGEFLYRDDEGIICRKLNWREAMRSCLRDTTVNAVLVLEALPPTTREDLLEALSVLEADVRRHCGGQTKVQILDKETPTVTL